jgi:hypothetical protein
MRRVYERKGSGNKEVNQEVPRRLTMRWRRKVVYKLEGGKGLSESYYFLIFN